MSGRFVEVPVARFKQLVPGQTLTKEVFEKLAALEFNEKVLRGLMFLIFLQCTVAQNVLNTCYDTQIKLASPSGQHKLVAKVTGNQTDPIIADGSTGKKPDVVLYPDTPKACEQYNLKNRGLPKSAEGDHKLEGSDQRQTVVQADDAATVQSDFHANTSWAWASLDGEDEQEATSSRSFKSDADGVAEARGQIIEYATEVMQNQHRLFCFMIVVAGCHARFLRWDQWGAIVSESFNFVKNKEIMFEFLYNYGAMTQVERGYDPTVIPATDSEIREMKVWKATIMKDERKRLSSYQEKCFDEAMSGKWPICKVFVPKEDIIRSASLEPKEAGCASAAALKVVDDADAVDNLLAGLELIVGRPLHASHLLIGQSTQAHVAYDIKNNRLVFIKTSWHAESKKVQTEHDTYIHLWSHGVQHIARPVSAGNVSSGGILQCTSKRGTSDVVGGMLAASSEDG
ncbi:hypothetical protein IEO21_10478 [Rhodonia placenta]|uniref:Fungal-type protein kinase domain-containing protein n=1 Tax=Rhodonia placenta TaxID=104341 RepID=A0A8H7TWX8_9APHY|nr:hypothetical protein IEO21_10478 [Postia placenta]